MSETAQLGTVPQDRMLAEAIGHFITRWSLAEASLIMPMLLAMRSQEQGVAASVLSSANSTEAKVAMASRAIENSWLAENRRAEIKLALKKLSALCEDRNRICHHIWALKDPSQQPMLIDWRKRGGDQERTRDINIDFIINLTDKTIEAAFGICKICESNWISDSAVELSKQLIREVKSPRA